MNDTKEDVKANLRTHQAELLMSRRFGGHMKRRARTRRQQRSRRTSTAS